MGGALEQYRRWQALGFRPLASTDSVRKLLGSGKFGDPPPYLFEDPVIERLGEWRTVEERTHVVTVERMIFKLPRQLTE